MAERKTAKSGAKKSAEKKEPVTEVKEQAPAVEATAESATAPIYQVVAPKEPDVRILYIDSVIPNNEIPIGQGRKIIGSGRVFTVSLSHFEGEFQTGLTQYLLKHRKFIVLTGLTEDQRRQYGVDYREGEVLRNEGMFDFLFNCPVNEAKEIFSKLCVEHRELVARRFGAAYEAKDNRITRDRVEALNEISKADYKDGKGAFTEILEGINKII